jgi:putative oxidoreductase
MKRLLETTAPAAVIWIRVAVAIVFVSEGIQKFLFAAALGAGRFAKIGIPVPDVMGPFIGFIEIACGALVLVGLVTRLGALLLLADMTVAILSTKIPILIGHGYWRFAAPAGKTGLWGMLHEARTDFSMWLACLFLLLVGAGTRSLDARLGRHV